MSNARIRRNGIAVAAILAVTMTIAGPAWAVPGNDDFGSATAVGALPFTETLHTTGATVEAGEPSPTCASSSGASVWYTATSPGGTLEVSTFGSKFDTVLAVYTGSGLGDLTEVSCNDDAEDVGSLQSRLQLASPVGSILRIQVSGIAGAAGRMTLSVGVAGADTPGDDFDDAIVATALPFTYLGDNSEYTGESGEPFPCNFDVAQRSIWFRYDPVAEGGFQASTLGSQFDTVIHGWEGTSLGSLDNRGCNDETDHFDGTSRMAVRGEPGDALHFQVDGYFGSSGPLTFTLDVTGMPANDDFADAQEVTLPFDVEATTQAATVEAGEPQGCEPTGPSIWYTFSTDSPLNLLIGTENTTFEYPFWPLATVWQGTSIDDLEMVACGHGLQSFTPLPGETYYVQVAGHPGEIGGVRTTGARGVSQEVGAIVAGAGAYAAEDGKFGVYVAGPFAIVVSEGDLHLDDGGAPNIIVCAFAAIIGLCV